jgi:hypothetical protein
MEIRINIQDISIQIKDTVQEELNRKVNEAIGLISAEDIAKQIVSEIKNYNFEYIVEEAFENIDSVSLTNSINKSIKKHIIEKLK